MKAAIYCRLSEEDKNKQFKNEESNSIQNQKSMLIEYAVEHNWEIYGIYSDDDYTGADRSRPEFNRLLKDAENNKFDIILCKTQSRFTREVEIVEKYIHGLFIDWGIRFVSIVDNADTNNKGNKKARQINALINEWYLEDMSENIKSVLTNRRKNGYHIGSFAPYGYKKDPERKGHLVIDDEAANIIREIFNLFSIGYGKYKIAQMLNDKALPNPSEYKRLKELNYKPTKNSKIWRYSTVSDILKNEVYIGNLVQGKYGSISYKTKKNKPRQKENWYRVENTHDAIINQELWDKVQKLIKKNNKPFKVGKIGLFSGKVYCMYCKSPLRSTKTKDKYYLRCQSKYIVPNSCIGSFISVNTLENMVLNELINRKISNIEKLDRETVENLINKIYVGKRIKGTKEIPIEIHWNF